MASSPLELNKKIDVTNEISITASSGSVSSVYSYTAYVCNGFIEINLTVLTSSTVGGSYNVFSGTIDKYKPKIHTYGLGFYGGRTLALFMNTDGGMTIRNTGVDTLGASSYVDVSIVYMYA